MPLVRIDLRVGKPADHARMAELAASGTGLEPWNLFVSLVEVGREDWSFGNGLTPFAQAE